MSAASVVLFFFLCLLAVFWQIRFNRGMKLSGEEADSHPGCVVILAVGFFAAFVIFRRYYDFFPSPELQEIRERQGVFGDILRGLVRQVILQIIITLAIKSLLFALTVFLCFRLAPLFLIYCIGALSHMAYRKSSATLSS